MDTKQKLTVDDVTYERLAQSIDHSLLRPELTMGEIDEGCALAGSYRVASVCARPADVARCRDALAGTGVDVGTVIGFPHGSTTTAVKVAEARGALDDGAVELDMVCNIGWLRSGEVDAVQADIAAVVGAAGDAAIVKVILENAYLDEEQKVAGCRAAEAAGAAFVKTSTGFAPTGATLADLRLMRATVSPHVQVKAAGGVRTLDQLLEVMDVGVTRIGATRTATILDEYRARTRG